MGLLDNIRQMVGLGNEPTPTEVVQGINSQVESNKLPTSTEWFFSPVLGQPRNININQLRLFAITNWVKMCVDTISEEIAGIEWEIVPVDPTDYSEKNLEQVREFYSNLNRNNEPLRDIHKKLIRDIMELDSGVLVKVFDDSKNLTEIFAKDGGTFVKILDKFGIELGYAQYSISNPTMTPIEFSNREIVYLMQHPRTNSAYGWSPIQSLLHILESLNNTVKFNREFFEKNAIPSGILEVVNDNRDDFQRFRDEWTAKIKGRFHKFPIVNFPAKFHQFTVPNKDMQWLEGQKMYMNLVFAMFKLSPAEAGFTEDVNKATAESQERISIKKAIKPILQMLNDMHNRRIIQEEFGFHDVCFKFLDPDISSEQRQRENDVSDLQNGVITVNEVRANRGLDPVEWGDVPMSQQTPQLDFFSSDDAGASPMLSFNLKPTRRKSKKKKTSFKNQTKLENFSKVPRKLPEKIYEGDAETYEEFIAAQFDRIKDKLIASLKRNKVLNKSVQKSFGAFLSDLLNLTTTMGFANLVRRFVKKEFAKGVELVEDELKQDVGVRDSDDMVLDSLTEQQLNGYTFQDGRAFPGIKGVSDQMQNKILLEVQKGVDNDESIGQVTERIEEVFETTKSRAMTIARSETNRIVNSGKLNAYKNSGVPGVKLFSAHLDKRTSDVCERLQARYGKQGIPLDAPFIDPDTGKGWLAPPTHPNCRSTILFRPQIE